MKNDNKCHQMVNLHGQIFNYWTVLYKDSNKSDYWICECACGTIRSVRGSSLRNGNSKSCGCHKHNRLHIDLTGQKFGRWTVIEQGEYKIIKSGRRYRTWLCICECGTVREVVEYSLVSNKSISCGCLRNEILKKNATYKDLTGQKFGEWTVMYRVDDKFFSSGGRHQMWHCKCSCGFEKDIASIYLKSGESTSCGCKKPKSQGENEIRSVLDLYGFKYVREFGYVDLVGVNGGKLLYDFLVYDNNLNPLFLIECHGEQHYRPVEYFGGIKKFKIQQKHDILKENYAKCIGLPLLIIRNYGNTPKQVYNLCIDTLKNYKFI